jgi:ERCC4-related helicase
MVKICDCESPYPTNNEEKYIDYFNQFAFELSNFQKYAIESIVEGDHVLVTAHTGSGKTLPAEFAIEYFVSKGKKVIYTSPIKALSNQKFYEFTKKFPHISFGILTGDIKSLFVTHNSWFVGHILPRIFKDIKMEIKNYNISRKMNYTVIIHLDGKKLTSNGFKIFPVFLFIY